MDTIKLLILITSGIYFIFLLCIVAYNIKLHIITTKYIKTKAGIISTSDGDYIPNFNKKDWFKRPEKKYLVFKYEYKNKSYTNFSYTALKEATDYEYKTLPVYVNPDKPKKSWIQTDIMYRYCKSSQILTYSAITYMSLTAVLAIAYAISNVISMI